MLQSTPFLLFDGDCAEAMEFYHSAFGGELTLSRLGDTPMREQFPEEKHGRIINAVLTSDGFVLSASDWMASPAFDPVRGNMSAVYVTDDDGQRLQRVVERLKDGADREHLQDLHDLPFGTYGQLYDRFGVQWIFLRPA